MTKALVTGVAGFIGSSLAIHLSHEGWDVVGVDSLTDYYEVSQKRQNLRDVALCGVQVVEADLLDEGVQLANLLSDVEVVFHQAGQPGVRSSWEDGFGQYLCRNVLATQRLLEAVKGAGDIEFIYASSSSVYGHAQSWPCTEESIPRPFSPYGVTKLAGEHLVSLYAENFGLHTTSLRYFTVFGPRQRPDMAFHRFCQAALTGQPIPVFGDGRQIRDFTFVDDVVRANIAAASKPGGADVYNVAGGTHSSVADVLQILGEISPKSLNVQHHSRPPGDVLRTGGSISRAETELMWSPRVSLAEGLAEQFDWHARMAALRGTHDVGE